MYIDYLNEFPAHKFSLSACVEKQYQNINNLTNAIKIQSSIKDE